jgi:hypothetical protein
MTDSRFIEGWGGRCLRGAPSVSNIAGLDKKNQARF